MGKVILIVTNLLLCVVFYMVGKMQDRSDAKELQENLKTQN